MGIDLYTRWKGISEEDKQKQITGFSVTAGDVGYLREAYHGEPYATRFLVREAFEKKGNAKIPAKTLRRRLKKTLLLVEERQMKVYKEPADSEDTKVVKQAFIDFVELCERKEQETGEPVEIIASY